MLRSSSRLKAVNYFRKTLLDVFQDSECAPVTSSTDMAKNKTFNMFRIFRIFLCLKYDHLKEPLLLLTVQVKPGM